MTHSTLNIENKLYRQVLKGIGFYEQQQNHAPTMEEVKSFVLLENKNLSPISHLDEKLTQSLEKLEELHVCRRFPDNTFSLYNKNPVIQINELTRKRANQSRTVRFEVTDFTFACRLVAQQNVPRMEGIEKLQQEFGFVGSSADIDGPGVESREEDGNDVEAGPSGESEYGQVHVDDSEVNGGSEQEEAAVGSSEDGHEAHEIEVGDVNDVQEVPEAGPSEDKGLAHEPIEETIEQMVEQFEQDRSESVTHISHMFT